VVVITFIPTLELRQIQTASIAFCSTQELIDRDCTLHGLMDPLSPSKMLNASIEKAECGSTDTLQNPDPKKQNSFRWKAILLSLFITSICALTFSKHITLTPARIRDISGRANKTKFMNVFQPYKPVRVSPDKEKNGCKEDMVLMKHQFGFSYRHPFVGGLKWGFLPVKQTVY
jgi:hypothetical protein